MAEASRPRLYLVRHGETDWNDLGRLLSFTDEPLNATGERQAQDLAASVRALRWDRAICSPMLRTRRTAEILLEGAVDAPALALDNRLVEMGFGPYEGWTDAELAADPVAATRRRDGVDIPWVEPTAAVAERAGAFFADLPPEGRILVVGHGRMLRILIAAVVLGVDPATAHWMRMRNCRPAVVEPGPRPLLLGLNLAAVDGRE